MTTPRTEWTQPDRIAVDRKVFPRSPRPLAIERRPPRRSSSTAERIGRTLDAVPDRVDARDYVYQPRLGPLPDQLVNCAAVPEVLDQGREGACTGFALAAVINFLLRQHGRSDERVSPRMLYELARCYDAWPGEAYDGSSARGAMKAWVRHGVCSRATWPDDRHGIEPYTAEIGIEALRTPGGAFYRVGRRDVRDMHAALAEVGALYATLMVHEGGGEPGPMCSAVQHVDSAGTHHTLSLPVIQRCGHADSGHAIAIVGYTHDGFIIQNSWGTDWGAGGFALLPYEDYLLHGIDVWVAQLGVPIVADLWHQGGADSTVGFHRAAPAIPLARIRPHVVNVGNNGELSTSGRYWTTTDDLARLFSEEIPRATEGWARKRVMLYLHGGLNDEETVARRIIAFRDVCLANEVYPLHIMWETGLVETLNSIIRDHLTDVDERAGNWLRRFREGLVEAWDRTLELTVAAAGSAVWRKMKANAILSSQHPDGIGGMQLLVQHALAAIGRLAGPARDAWELHVVGHSAGCIYAAHAVSALCGLGVPFATLQLMAPAIRVDEFKNIFLAPIREGFCPRPTLYILSDADEHDDAVGPYGKSLLYLVSNAFEGRRETPLLGMETYLRRDEDLAVLFGPPPGGLPAVVVAGLDQGPGSISRSSTHGGFDNDPETLNSVLFRILGGPPSRPFTAHDLPC